MTWHRPALLARRSCPRPLPRSGKCTSPPLPCPPQDDTEDEEEEEAEDSDSDGRPKRKRSARRKKSDVKSQSSAALAMLAGAASKPTTAAAAAAAAAMQQNLGELWGNLNGGAGALQAGASGIDLSKLSTEQQQQLLANPDYAVRGAACC